MISTARKVPGTIDTNTAYTVDEFRRRCRLGDFSYSELRKLGLPVISINRKQFILGSDWIEFLKQQRSA